MTLADLTPEKIAQFEAERKAKLAQIQARNEQAKQDWAANRERTTQYYQQRQGKPVIRTVKKTHECYRCGATIPAGQKATEKIVPWTGRVYAEGLQRVYLCQGCKPIGADKA